MNAIEAGRGGACVGWEVARSLEGMGTIWCLHGAVGMAADWEGFEVPGWRVRAIDLWAFFAEGAMSMEEAGVSLNRMVAEESGAQVLMGYSMGGRLGLQALLGEGAGCWDAAVIISAHPGLEMEEERALRRVWDEGWAREAEGDWAEFLAKWNAQGVLTTGSGAKGLAERGGLEAQSLAVARSFRAWSLGEQEPLWERMRMLPCPVLWVVGEKDEKFRVLGDRAISAIRDGGDSSRGGASLWVAPGAGHRVPWEMPEGFARRVGEFLERTMG